jgi:hypothetical protein
MLDKWCRADSQLCEKRLRIPTDAGTARLNSRVTHTQFWRVLVGSLSLPWLAAGVRQQCD